jgi:hypothetical protein
MQTIEGHKRDAEAFFIAAMDTGAPIKFTDVFAPLEPISFSKFFEKFAGIADFCEDAIITYEVINE